MSDKPLKTYLHYDVSICRVTASDWDGSGHESIVMHTKTPDQAKLIASGLNFLETFTEYLDTHEPKVHPPNLVSAEEELANQIGNALDELRSMFRDKD